MNDTNESGVLTSPRVAKFAVTFLAVATALLAVSIISVLETINEPPNAAQNVITVSGEGKVSAAPDLATISFSVSEDAATAAAAQDAAAKKVNAALAVVKAQGIADKDVQTSSYNVYPRYASQEPCYAPTPGGAMPPCIYNGNAQTVIGYTASQSVTVKVHDTSAVGKLVSALGPAGISDINGPDLTVENPDALQAEARASAIADARSKADALAKDLGVHIVRVTNYSEGGGGYPMPMYAEASGGVAKDAAVPSIPTGQNEITVDVSVTYEIR